MPAHDNLSAQFLKPGKFDFAAVSFKEKITDITGRTGTVRPRESADFIDVDFSESGGSMVRYTKKDVNLIHKHFVPEDLAVQREQERKWAGED